MHDGGGDAVFAVVLVALPQAVEADVADQASFLVPQQGAGLAQGVDNLGRQALFVVDKTGAAACRVLALNESALFVIVALPDLAQRVSQQHRVAVYIVGQCRAVAQGIGDGGQAAFGIILVLGAVARGVGNAGQQVVFVVSVTGGAAFRAGLPHQAGVGVVHVFGDAAARVDGAADAVIFPFEAVVVDAVVAVVAGAAAFGGVIVPFEVEVETAGQRAADDDVIAVGVAFALFQPVVGGDQIALRVVLVAHPGDGGKFQAVIAPFGRADGGDVAAVAFDQDGFAPAGFECLGLAVSVVDQFDALALLVPGGKPAVAALVFEQPFRAFRADQAEMIGFPVKFQAFGQIQAVVAGLWQGQLHASAFFVVVDHVGFRNLQPFVQRGQPAVTQLQIAGGLAAAVEAGPIQGQGAGQAEIAAFQQFFAGDHADRAAAGLGAGTGGGILAGRVFADFVVGFHLFGFGGRIVFGARSLGGGRMIGHGFAGLEGLLGSLRGDFGFRHFFEPLGVAG